MPRTIERIRPSLLPAFLDFFDNSAFQDNPEWGNCYCQCYHTEGGAEAWCATTKEQNRERAILAIKQGRQPGFLAFEDGEPVAWVNAGPRRSYPMLLWKRTGGTDEDDIVSIVCFLVAPTHRRRGIATQLLDHVIRSFEGSILEAYPRKIQGSASEHYHGPLDLYLRAGFVPVSEGDGTVVVRRTPPRGSTGP